MKKKTGKTKVKTISSVKFKQIYDKAGRPTLYDEVIVKKLEKAFEEDLTIGEACNRVGISRPTFYEWKERYPDFAYKIDKAQGALFDIAKKNIAGAVQSGDIETTQWLLSRRQRDRYATKVENELSAPEPLTPEEEKEISEALDNAEI